jgi:hypothetical protein
MGMSKKAGEKKRAIEQVARGEVPRDGRPQAEDFDWRTFDPAMLEGGAEAPLATELVTYRDRLDELLQHEGQYVVIKGTVVAGFFRDRRSAVAAAIAAYGPGPVLIKKIVEREPVRRIGHAIL